MTAPQSKSSVLMIDCADEMGLIHKVTSVLLSHGCNITSNSEFVDRDHERFFMRSEMVGEVDEIEVTKELKNQLPEAANVRFIKQHKKKIVILATKEYHCLGDLLVRNYFGELNAEVLAVISNHQVLQNFTEKFDIPFHYVPHQEISRKAHEEAVLKLIDQYSPEFLVLAKYMRVLTPDFIKKFPYRAINIHHSFLPAFIGANPYRQAFDRGVKIIGATAHFVTDNLDEGPIIMQETIRTDHTKNAKQMARAGKDVEKIVLSKALKLVFEDRVFVMGNKTIIFD